MDEKKYLYGLTVQGIQSYIFATNKLKEIVGASEIIEQLCTTLFYEFLKDPEKTGSKGIYHLNAAGNIRFQTDKATAETIFKEYHEELLEKAPGVPFSQAVVEITKGGEYEAIQELDKKLRGQRNAPLYPTDLGVMSRSKHRRTGNFAFKEQIYAKKDGKIIESEFLDVVSNEKYIKSDEKILSGKTKIDGYDISYPIEFSELAKNSKHSWLALIHIDGNGMGIQIKKILEDSSKKFEALKEFSDSVGNATLNAFRTSVKEVFNLDNKTELEKTITLPMRPIIIGGDDVTLIIQADLALEFTRIYLEAFEKKTKDANINNGEGLTACAGIAYVKEKFPFHYSANLAEELCTYAKNKSDRQYSCVQFHKVQDSIIDNYNEIITRELKVDGEAFTFQNGPYYILSDDNNDTIKINETDIKVTTITKLTEDIQTLKNDDAPTNGMREWIDAKFNNPTMAETLMTRLKGKSKGYTDILKNEKAFIDYHTLIAINTKTN